MADILISGISIKNRIRFIYTDVTVAAKALEARHLCGPTSGMSLAEGLASAALLSSDASSEEESVVLQLKASGPITGMLVEAFANGDLRGYTNVKIMNDLDDLPEISTQAALGDHLTAQIAKSEPGRILNQARISLNKPSIKALIARYFNHSMQTPTAVEINVRSDAGGIIYARGLIAERMPDGNPDTFLHILESFDDGSVRTQLAQACSLKSFEPLFLVDDIEERETRHLQFRCRCNREKAESSISAIPLIEIEEMLNDGKKHSIHCHLCGEDYNISDETLRRFADSQKPAAE